MINNASINTTDDQMEITTKLKELNLDLNIILQACIDGVIERQYYGELSTRAAAGFNQWNKTVQSLRGFCCGKFWHKYESNGLEGIISNDKKIKIIPCSGNSNTGIFNAIPSNKNSKGEVAMNELVESAQQLSLFINNSEHIYDDNNLIYLLLYYSNAKELRCELSRPNYSSNGKIISWEERIILPAYKFSNYEFNPQQIRMIDNKKLNIPSVDINIVRRKFN